MFKNTQPCLKYILIDTYLYTQNYMRVVEVWLEGKYKDYFYTREPQIKGFFIIYITI